MIESARYLDNGGIEVVVDGVVRHPPDDPANRHRQMLAEWEAEGGAIAPYVAPPSPTPEEIAEEVVAEYLQSRAFKPLAEVLWQIAKAASAGNWSAFVIDDGAGGARPIASKADFVEYLRATVVGVNQ